MKQTQSTRNKVFKCIKKCEATKSEGTEESPCSAVLNRHICGKLEQEQMRWALDSSVLLKSQQCNILFLTKTIVEGSQREPEEEDEDEEDGRGSAFQTQQRAPKASVIPSPSKKQKKGR